MEQENNQNNNENVRNFEQAQKENIESKTNQTVDSKDSVSNANNAKKERENKNITDLKAKEINIKDNDGSEVTFGNKITNNFFVNDENISLMGEIQSNESLAFIEDIFIPPSDIEQLINYFKSFNLLVLCQRKNSGRKITSKWLLHKLNYNNIYLIKSEIADINKLLNYEFEASTGYIFTNIKNKNNINDSFLTQLNKKIGKSKSKIVIIDELSLYKTMDSQTINFAKKLTELNDVEMMFEKYKNYYIKNKFHDDKFKKIIKDIDKHRRNILANTTNNINFTADLFLAIEQEYRNEIIDELKSLEDIMNDIMKKQKSYKENYLLKYKELPDFQYEVLLFVIACLNKCTYTYIFNRYNLLMKSLSKHLGEEEQEKIKKHPISNIMWSEISKKIHVEKTSSKISTHYGNDSCECIILKDENDREFIIEFFWNEYNWKNEILLWIRDSIIENINQNETFEFKYPLSIFAITHFNQIAEFLQKLIAPDATFNYFISVVVTMCYLDETISLQTCKLIEYWATDKKYEFNILALHIYYCQLYDIAGEIVVSGVKKIIKKHFIDYAEDSNFNIILSHLFSRILNQSNCEHKNDELLFLINCLNKKHAVFFQNHIDATIYYSQKEYQEYKGLIYPAILYKYAFYKQKRKFIIKFFLDCIENSVIHPTIMNYLDSLSIFVSKNKHCKKAYINFINHLLDSLSYFYSQQIISRIKCLSDNKKNENLLLIYNEILKTKQI